MPRVHHNRLNLRGEAHVLEEPFGLLHAEAFVIRYRALNVAGAQERFVEGEDLEPLSRAALSTVSSPPRWHLVGP
jgi:hypothetical protein